MRECNNRLYGSPRDCHADRSFDQPAQQLIISKEGWQRRLAEYGEQEQTDIKGAIEEAAALNADVHLHKKVGSKFLGIALIAGTGPGVKVMEWPEVRA